MCQHELRAMYMGEGGGVPVCMYWGRLEVTVWDGSIMFMNQWYKIALFTNI